MMRPLRNTIRLILPSVLIATVLICVIGGAAWYRYGSFSFASAAIQGRILTYRQVKVEEVPGKRYPRRRVTVAVYNLSDRPVTLQGGTSNCSCTSLVDLPLTIDVKGSGVFRVDISPDSEGRFPVSRPLTVYSNHPSAFETDLDLVLSP